MRTFIAFKIDSENDSKMISDGIERVRKHYYESIDDNVEVTENVVIYKNLGAIIFDLKDSALLWKDVFENHNFSLITYAPPSNWKKYCKSHEVNKGPEELIEFIEENDETNFDFSAPSCFALIDKRKDEMSIFTDSIGFSRLYEYRGQNGWFWSNRAGALPLFAGEKAEINKNGWANLVASGWFIGNTSPIERVIRVKPGIKIHVNTNISQPRRLFDYGAFGNIVSNRRQEKLNLKKIAEDMKFTLDSFKSLWELPVVVDLSGGKDSRICSAVVISSGMKNIKFRTVANYDDEVQVSKELLDRIGLQNNHIIENPTNEEEETIKKNTIKDRMRLYFHITDGECNPAVVQNNIIEKSLYSTTKKLKIAGALGEFAKPIYYNSEKQVNKLIQLNNDAALFRLKNSYLKYSAVLPDMESRSIETLSFVVESGKSFGLSGLSLLEYFYISERGRRWPPQNNVIDSYSVFFSNEFLIQSMNMSLEERMNGDFFSDIIKYLVPEWKNVRYFKRSMEEDERSSKKMRLWQTSDKDGIEEILNSPKLWNEYFDEEQILRLWTDAKHDLHGVYTDAVEKLFYRVIMISNYHDHLERLNSNID